MSELLLAAEGVTYGYPGTSGPRALTEVALQLRSGEIVALLGPNGSGKSTLMKLLSGIIPLPAQSPRVLVSGRDLRALRPLERARAVAYVPPELRAEFPITAFETVMMGRVLQGSGFLRHLTDADRGSIRIAMERCSCWALRDRDLGTLSGGERQLVALARALAQGARLLFLDEALGKMDLHHQAATGRLLRELAAEGYAVLLVSHDVNLVTDWADQCYLLKAGMRVSSGPTREVLTAENIRALYPSADLVIGTNPVTGSPKVFFRI